MFVCLFHFFPVNHVCPHIQKGPLPFRQEEAPGPSSLPEVPEALDIEATCESSQQQKCDVMGLYHHVPVPDITSKKCKFRKIKAEHLQNTRKIDEIGFFSRSMKPSAWPRLSARALQMV